MPLHGQHELSGQRSFEGLDHAVQGRASHHAQAASNNVSRLVVRRIYREAFAAHNRRQSRVRIDFHRVRFGYLATRIVFDTRLNILDKRPGAVHVERLQSIADAEDRLLLRVGVPED
jgi:hypothetical protein